jgi:hypothetical protein
MGEEAVEEGIEILQPLEIDPHDEAILAGDPVAFDDLGQALSQRADLAELARHGRTRTKTEMG